MVVKIKLNAEHYDFNTSAQIFQYIFQQSNYFEQKLLTATVVQIFYMSWNKLTRVEHYWCFRNQSVCVHETVS
jgi:hypothetical protein